MPQRRVEIAVVSDLHLGTYASRAREFTAYLKSIDPRVLILNGDIIDGWQFSKRYFPPDHISAIKEIFSKLSSGTRVIYITGNHDDCMRRYSDLELGGFLLTDKVVIEVNGKKYGSFTAMYLIIPLPGRQNSGGNWAATAMQCCCGLIKK